MLKRSKLRRSGFFQNCSPSLSRIFRSEAFTVDQTLSLLNEMASNYEDSVPIDVDSNGENIAEVDSKEAKRPATIPTGVYKPQAIAAGVVKAPKRQRKLTSTMWEHYEFVPPDEEDNLFCKCKKCGQTYYGDSRYGTGNLKRQLGNCERRNVTDIGQLIFESRSGCLGSRRSGFDSNEFRHLLAVCVVKHELPFEFVEYDGVRDMLTYLNPDVKFVSTNTTKSDVIKLFAREKEKLKCFLESFPGRVAFTSDCWTSLNTDGFISLTAHYIGVDWVLHKRILSFSFMPPPHNGVSLAEKLLLLLKDWGLDKKVMSLTLDNVNDLCVDMMKVQLKLLCNGDYFHVRCCAHILNLIVTEGLKDVDEAVSKVRECVKYCKGFQTRKQRFLESCKLCDIIYDKGLCQDVPTRWNSTYLMLESALYYKRVFSHLEVVDSNFTHCPRMDEWAKIEKICGFLKVLYEVTCTFLGSKYPTSNLYFPNLVRVKLLLKEEMESSDAFMRNMTAKMFGKFEKYWSEVSTIMAIATVLDPRFKYLFVEWAYKKVYGDSYDIELRLLKEKLFALYGEYAKSSKGSSASSNPASSNAQAASNVELQYDSFMRDFDQYSSNEFESVSKSELEMYLEENKLPRVEDFDVLGYWKMNQDRYPLLSTMARDILAIPLSTVASESAFSVGRRVLDAVRSSLKPDIMEAVICLRDWLFGQALMPPQVNLEELCGDVMKMNLNDNQDCEDQSKSAGSGFGQNSALIN